LPLVHLEAVDFLGEQAHLELGLQVDAVVRPSAFAIALRLPVLAHQDHRRLHRRDARQDEVQQDERIRIERSRQEADRVLDHPRDEHRAEQAEKLPTAAEARDAVGHAMRQRLTTQIVARRLAAEDFLLAQRFHDAALDFGDLAALVGQHLAQLLAAEPVLVGATHEPGPVPIRVARVHQRGHWSAHEVGRLRLGRAHAPPAQAAFHEFVGKYRRFLVR